MRSIGGLFGEAEIRLAELFGELVIRGAIAGMLTPWRPSLVTLPPGKDVPLPKPLANLKTLAKPSWPTIQAAVAWLKGKGVLRQKDVDYLTAYSKATGAAMASASGLRKQIQQALAESLKAGDGTKEWQERLGEIVTTQNYRANNIGRTFTHRAYHEGLDVALKSPGVALEFPYATYAATNDARTRPTHAAMDDKVAHIGSPLYKQMQELIAQWQCRCTLIPISREEALAKGIDDNTGWVEPEDRKPDVVEEAEEAKPLDADELLKPKRIADIEAAVKAWADQNAKAIEASAFTSEKPLDKADPVASLSAWTEPDATLARVRTSYRNLVDVDRSLEKQAAEAAKTKQRIIREARGQDFTESQVKELMAAEDLEGKAKRVRESVKAASKSLAAATIRSAEVPPAERQELKPQFPQANVQPVKAAEEATAFLSRLLKQGTAVTADVPVLVAKLKPGESFRARFMGGAVQIDPTTPTRVVVHEIGHKIEQQIGVSGRGAVRAFLESRRTGELPRKLADDFPTAGFGSKETYTPANLPACGDPKDRAYAAKDYPNETELVSMGVELLYKDAAGFAARDPEYFKLIVGLLRGSFQ